MSNDNNGFRKKDIPYSIALDHILSLRSTRKNHIAERAFNTFVREANVDEETETEELFQALFLEWFLFDYNYKNGKSPLEHFINYHPASVSPEIIDAFRQSAESNRVGNFWIERIFPKDGIVVLSDTDTGEQIETCDYTMSNELGPNGRGMLGARIVYVDSEWVFAGNPVYYYPVSPTEEMKKMLIGADENPVTFISLVRSSFGRKDERTPGFIAPMVNATPEERDARIEEISRLFDEWYNEGIIALSWDDIADAIEHDETVEMRPTRLVELALAVDENHESDVEIEDMDTLNEIISALMDAWNLLPHDYMDGK